MTINQITVSSEMNNSAGKSTDKLFKRIVTCLSEIKSGVIKISDRADISKNQIDKITENIDEATRAVVDLQSDFGFPDSCDTVVESGLALPSEKKMAKQPVQSPVYKILCVILVAFLLTSVAFSFWLRNDKNEEIARLTNDAELMRAEFEQSVSSLNDTINVKVADIDSLNYLISKLRKSESDLKSKNAKLDSRWNSHFPVEISLMTLYGGDGSSMKTLYGTNVTQKIRSLKPVINVSSPSNKTVTLEFKMIQSSDKYKTYNRNGNTAGHFSESKTCSLKSGSNTIDGPVFTSTATYYFHGKCVIEVWLGDKCLYTKQYIFK